MREAVLHLSGFYDKSFYGTNYNSKDACTMADLNFRVQHVVENEVGVIQGQLKRNNVTIIHGTGCFTSPHHVRVDNANGFGELRRRVHHHRHRHQARRQFQSSHQRPQHHQQRSDSQHAANSPHPYRRRRRRHRRRIRLHVRHPRRPRDHYRKAPAPARICRYRNGRSAHLPHARPARHHAPQ